MVGTTALLFLTRLSLERPLNLMYETSRAFLLPQSVALCLYNA